MKNFRLAIHYHIPIRVEAERITCPNYYGLWIDSLAKHFKKIVLISYTTEEAIFDYELESTNLELVDLGVPADSFLRRFFKLPSLIKTIACSKEKFDGIGYRMPTFLGVYFRLTLFNKPSFFLLVGNMVQMSKIAPISRIKRLVLTTYWYIDSILISKLSKKTKVFSISDGFTKEYPNINEMQTIFTSTITFKDVIQTPKEHPKKPINLIYIGRLSPEKGLDTLIGAVAIQKPNIGRVIILGSYDDEDYQKLSKLSHDLRVEDIVCFEGYVAKGAKFNSYLDGSDVMIIPSIWDAQTRCVWEGMARGLPIIASRGVQSLNSQYSHKKEVYFFEPYDKLELAHAIRDLHLNDKLYKKLSKTSLLIASEKTLEHSANILVSSLKKSPNFSLM